MKNVFLIIALSALLTSCCVVTSRECFCNPPAPFLAESTKDWIAPFVTEEQKFITTGALTREQKITRAYEEGTECVGGDECCANNPTHTTRFLFDTVNSDNILLYTKAIQNEVIFSAKPHGYSPDIYIAVLDVTTGKFTQPNGISLTETDTIINNSNYLKVIFKKTDPAKTEIQFEQMEFVKGIGITGYTDTSGQVWKKK